MNDNPMNPVTSFIGRAGVGSASVGRGGASSTDGGSWYEAMSKAWGQTLDGQVQRVVRLGEAQSQDIRRGILRVEPRDRDRGHAMVLDRAQGEGAVVQCDARGGQIDGEEIGRLRGQHGEAGGGQPGGEAAA